MICSLWFFGIFVMFGHREVVHMICSPWFWASFVAFGHSKFFSRFVLSVSRDMKEIVFQILLLCPKHPCGEESREYISPKEASVPKPSQ